MNSDQFYQTPLRDFTFVSGDIETTGFYDDEIITTFTLEHDGNYVAFLNTDGQTTDESNLEAEIKAESGFDVAVHSFLDDGELLSAVREYISLNFTTNDTIFTFYNGETYRGGFDLRFIRSVCLRTGAPFPFKGFAYLDLMPLFNKQDRFNVTHIDPNPDIDDLFNKGPLQQFADELGIQYPSNATKAELVEIVETHKKFTETALAEYCETNGISPPDVNPGGLVGVYNRISRLMRQRDDTELVENWSQSDCDPFEPDESVKAVETYHDGEFEKVLLHNIADVHKTGLLASLLPETEGAVTRKEIQPKFF